VQIWRVENMRDDNGNPKFGINPWPEEQYGEFYSGDSYIVLETTKDENSDKLNFDIYFWIGEHSTQVSFM
jgi:gelsolin